MIFYVAGLLGIFLTPLFLAEKHPNAPIAFPIRWLQAHFSHDTAIFIYALVSLGIAGILTYAMVVVDYLRYDASKKEKESAV